MVEERYNSKENTVKLGRNKTERIRSRMTQNEKIFILASDLLSVITIITDLFQLSGVIRLDLTLIVIINLIMLIVSFTGYKMKKRVRMRTIKAMRNKKKA